jgi:hypothetical protein
MMAIGNGDDTQDNRNDFAKTPTEFDDAIRQIASVLKKRLNDAR